VIEEHEQQSPILNMETETGDDLNGSTSESQHSIEDLGTTHSGNIL